MYVCKCFFITLSMAKEIERKFLVTDSSYRNMATGSIHIEQRYLSDDPHRTVRIRVFGAEGRLTVKGVTNGCVRDEWEYPIPFADATAMLALCPPGIEKTRWYVPYCGYTWEVDCFGGRLEGLVVAEVELPDAETSPALPPFIGREVTDDARYFNSSLAKALCPPVD